MGVLFFFQKLLSFFLKDLCQYAKCNETLPFGSVIFFCSFSEPIFQKVYSANFFPFLPFLFLHLRLLLQTISSVALFPFPSICRNTIVHSFSLIKLTWLTLWKKKDFFSLSHIITLGLPSTKRLIFARAFRFFFLL